MKQSNVEESAVFFDEEEPVYGYYISEDGSRQFGVVGRRNIVDMLQESRAESDFVILRKMFERNEISASEIVKNSFGDLENLSDGYLDALAVASEAQDLFSELPLEVRNKYGNDIFNFARSLDSGEFAQYLSESEKDSQTPQISNPVTSFASTLESLQRQLDALKNSGAGVTGVTGSDKSTEGGQQA